MTSDTFPQTLLRRWQICSSPPKPRDLWSKRTDLSALPAGYSRGEPRHRRPSTRSVGIRCFVKGCGRVLCFTFVASRSGRLHFRVGCGHVTSAAAGPDHEGKQMMVVVQMFRPRQMNQASVFNLTAHPKSNCKCKEIWGILGEILYTRKRKQAAVRFMTEEK